jgi:hypothetical protein
MNGPWHYKQAESALDQIPIGRSDAAQSMFYIQLAQAHAMLAVSAAMVEGQYKADEGERSSGMIDHFDDWQQVLS